MPHWLYKCVISTHCHCSRFYLYSREFAGCLITASSLSDADALCTQALWAGSCERCAVAAAAVHWLRLPTPKKTCLCLENTHRGRKKSILWPEWEVIVTSQRLPPPTPPFSAPVLHLAPLNGWWCLCVTADCTQRPETSHSKHLHIVNILPLLTVPVDMSCGVKVCLACETHSCQLLTGTRCTPADCGLKATQQHCGKVFKIVPQEDRFWQVCK